MRFLLDESADYPLAIYLRHLGHDVTSIVHDYVRGRRDEDVLDIAQREQRIVIANDRDFGELVFRQRLAHTGVIHFRLGKEDIPTKIGWLEHVLNEYDDQLDQFLVVTDRGVRVRRSEKP